MKIYRKDSVPLAPFSDHYLGAFEALVVVHPSLPVPVYTFVIGCWNYNIAWACMMLAQAWSVWIEVTSQILLCRFVFSFAVGVGPVPGLLLPEIFTNRIRAKAVAFCMSVHWVIYLIANLLYFVETFMCYINLVWPIFFCPSTRLGYDLSSNLVVGLNHI